MKKFAIVGLGLMGGSLGLALRKRFKGASVIGISRSQAKVREAKRRRMISWGTTDIGRGVKGADFVFVCTPVSLIPKYVERIDRFAKPGCIVTDVGSTKETLMKWASHRKFRAICFIGSHPMAGSHETGLRWAKGDLYDNSLVFVTPSSGAGAGKNTLRTLVQIWRKLGTAVFVCDAKRHDRIVAKTSHLPHAVASLLALSVELPFFRFAAGGLRDTTRIAQSDPILWRDIFSTNRSNLIKELKLFRKKLDSILTLLKRNDAAGIKTLLTRASGHRRALSC